MVSVTVFFLVGLFSLLIIRPCHAVRPYQPVHADPALEAWRWHSFPEFKGLGLACMTEDASGNLWFGLLRGVRRMDGFSHTDFGEADGLYGPSVRELCATPDGSVYAGTDWGISRFKDGAWSRVFPPEGDLAWKISGLVPDDDGNLWAGTRWGVLQLTGLSAKLYTTSDYGTIKNLAPYLDVEILPDEVAPKYRWGTSGARGEAGIVCMPTTTEVGVVLQVLPRSPAQNAGLRVGDRILDVDGQRLSAFGFPYGEMGQTLKLKVMQKDATKTSEVTVELGKVQMVTNKLSIYEVFKSQNGVMWFGLDEVRRGVFAGGILSYTPDQAGSKGVWHLYTKMGSSKRGGDGIGGSPRIGQSLDGTIWASSYWDDFAPVRFDGKKWTPLETKGIKDRSGHASIWGTRDGTLWIGGNFGWVYAHRNGTWTTYRHPKLKNQSEPSVPIPMAKFLRLYETSDGGLWFLGQDDIPARLDLSTDRWMTYEGLTFFGDTPDGSQWFVLREETDGRASPVVVRFDGKAWMRYGSEDGLMDAPYRLLITRGGEVWAWGTHLKGKDRVAVTARFDGHRWVGKTHSGMASAFREYEAPDGTLWFGAFGTAIPGVNVLDGLLRFDGGNWTHFTSQIVRGVYGIAQTSDGFVWAGKAALARFDGKIWAPVLEPVELTESFIDGLHAGQGGDLWVGHRSHGVFHYDPQAISEKNGPAMVCPTD
jgi:hypothetical protein